MKSMRSKNYRDIKIDRFLQESTAPLIAAAICAALCLLEGCITINVYQEPPGGKGAATASVTAKPTTPEPAKPAPPTAPRTLTSNPVMATLSLPVMPFSKRNWKFSCLTVINNTWDTLKDYPVKLKVPRKAGMQQNYGDLRFTDARDKELNYWLEEATPAAATVWVRVPRLEAESDTAISLYYGNDATGSASEGSKTFLFFDDFSNGFDGKRWERGRDASDGLQGVIVKDGSLCIYGGDGNYEGGWAKTRQEFPPHLTVESRCRLTRMKPFPDQVAGHLSILSADMETGVTYCYMNHFAPPYGFYGPIFNTFFCRDHESSTDKPSATKLSPFWNDIWFRQRLSYNGKASRDNLIYVRDKGAGEEKIIYTTGKTDKPTCLRFLVTTWGKPSMCLALDWVAVRPYAPVEPAAEIRG
ncbi:MAG: DUF2341 domain-containing protein [Candidatus Sumerlaeota bacterium]|nr:DUF2341 domain-containing protein [Candidatus Sumerlaeota bacterium]